jgi:uncharacterized lipoprotein YddW (UPF0748 family)
MRRTALLAIALAASLGSAESPRPAAGQAGRLGLWIECEGRLRTLDDPARIDAALERAAALGATDLFVQVFRGGRAWFPTEHADETPYRRARARGFDPLARVTQGARARGMRVHAWVNLLRAGEPGSPFVRSLGRGAVLGDETGRSLLDEGPWGRARAFRPDTPGVWLDPASPEVAARLAALLADLLRAHPDLDGVHFDYVRYPVAVRARRAGGPPADLGFSARSAADFRAATGRDARAYPDAFNAWRRDRLTGLVRTLRARLREARPRIILSAAVMPEPGSAPVKARQDWPRWTREGLLDLVVPMNYALDAVAFDRAARACVARRGKAEMLMGVGAWRFEGRAADVAARARLAMDAGASGVVLFSHDNLARRPGLMKRIGDLLRGEGALRSTSVSPRPRPSPARTPARPRGARDRSRTPRLPT